MDLFTIDFENHFGGKLNTNKLRKFTPNPMYMKAEKNHPESQKVYNYKGEIGPTLDEIITIGSNGVISGKNGLKKIEDRLNASRFLLDEVEKIGSIGHFEIKLATKEVVWSDQMFRMLKMRRTKDNTSSMWDLLNFIHDDDVQRVYDEYVKSIKAKKTVDLKFKITLDESEVRYVHNTAYIKKSDSDDSQIIYGVIHDITQDKQKVDSLAKANAKLEESVLKRTRILEESQRIYQLIARNFPNGEITIFDKNLNYVFVEGMEMGSNGITGGMLIGTNFLNRTDATINDDLKKMILEVFEGKNTSFELKSEDKTFMVYAVGLRDVYNDISKIMMVSQNITSLKKAEQDTRRSLIKEQHLNELKSRFVSMASHEFRTPLTTTMNSISLLTKYIGESDCEEKQLKQINRIKNSVHHLTTILNDFLSLDKLEQGKVKLAVSVFNFQSFVDELVGEMQGHAKNGQRIVYQHNGDENFQSDEQLIKIILNNLLTNAIKYSPEESTINITTTIEMNKLKAIVQDQGIGVPIEEQNQLFERFFRAQNALNTQGTGLGLNITKNYVELMHGEITFSSEPNKGTTFIVKLPMAKEISTS